MKQLLCVIVICLPFVLKAQMGDDKNEKGIRWTEGLSWGQIKAKAKQENKYIFMDCFATWCGPCKKMDKETYPNEKVGELVNENFIAVRVQMDSTENDNEKTREWYPAVQEINNNYKIPGYPAYLFFSPEGELVHQDVAYKSVTDFISLVNNVLDPSTQFAAIIKQYKSGKRETEFLLRTIKASKKLGQEQFAELLAKSYKADSLARLYKTHYLDKLDDARLFTKENIEFVTRDYSFLIYEGGSKGRFFDFFYHHPEKVDSLFGNGFAEYRVKNIITKEEVYDKLFHGEKAVTQTPDWENMKIGIAHKYDNYYAEKVISEFKPGFYQYTGNWQKWADLIEEKIQNSELKKGSKNLGVFTDDWTLNDNAWTVFKSCNDRTVLFRALKWSELAIKLKKPDAGIDGYLDTKANLIYKLGKRKKAIRIERKALQLNTEFARKIGKEKGDFFKEFSETVKKMKAGIPTWKLK